MQKKKTLLSMALFCLMVFMLFFRPLISQGLSLPVNGMPLLHRQTNSVSDHEVNIQPDSENASFHLPASLTAIGEEAFYGTAAGTVIFQGNPEVIENKAFGHMPDLTEVYLPESIVYIAQDAFDKNSLLTLFGADGSYAADWARDNGFSFKAVVSQPFANRLRIGSTVLQAAVLFAAAVLGLFIHKERNEGRKPGEGRSFRPQEMAELHSIHYDFP